MNYLDVANSPILWIACAIPVTLVIIQSVIFMKRAWKTGIEIGMSAESLKMAVKTGLITSIGPSLVILVGMVALIAVLGGPISWMRLSFVGSVMYESMAASYGTQAMGIALGDPSAMNVDALFCAIWAMVSGASGWVIFSAFLPKFANKLEKNVAKGNDTILKVVAGVAIFGAFGGFMPSYILGFDKGTLAILFGGIIMFICMYLNERKGIKFLREWGLAIALFGGMIITALI